MAIPGGCTMFDSKQMRMRFGLFCFVSSALLLGLRFAPVSTATGGPPPRAAAAAVAVAQAAPTAQDSLARIQQSLEKLEKLVPKIESTLEETRLLAKEARATNSAAQRLIKDVNDAVPDARKLIKEANDTMPLVRDTLSEFKLAAKNWKSVGERTDKLIEANEQKINNIILNTDKAVADADQTLKSTDKAMANLSETFNVENRNNATSILRNLEKSLQKGPSIADETELTLRQSRGTLKRIDETFDTINKGTKPGSPDSSGILKSLSEGSDRFNKAMADLNDLFRALDRNDGTLRRLIADPALYNHVDDAAILFTRLLPRLDRALKDMEVFADKLARHPESLGLGGVVRPSTGLKEPPRSQYPHAP
jgi:ABC-type transporter Mla subunit MlaD